MKKAILIITTLLILVVITFLVIKSNRDIQNFIGWYLVKPSSASPTDNWPISTPEEEGIDSNGLLKGYQYIADNKINAHSLLIIRNGKIIDETYFYPYQQNDMINIHSCTKSVLSALVGIAIEEGYIKNVDQHVLDFFPDRAIKNLSSSKKEITIRHLLTMSAGLEAKHPDEDMKNSKDWVQFILDKKMSEEPGTKFNYCDSTAHLLSAVLQKATGMSAYDYANSRLFKPMGIEVKWPSDPQGITYGFSEINMTTRDMAKFGQLFLNKGMWNGKQFVPADWVRESTKRHITTGSGNDYGYLWWCPPLGFQAIGLGQQIIEVIPLFNCVVVSTNGLDDEQYFDFDPFHSAIKRGHLPKNPEALSKLNRLKQQIALPGAVIQPSSAPPAALKAYVKTYYFPKNNPLNLKDLQVDFRQENYVLAKSSTYAGVQSELKLPLDGSYFKDTLRNSRNDTLFLKGYWLDDKTFIVVFEQSYKETMYFTFTDGKVAIKSVAGGKTVFEGLVGLEKL